MAVAADDWRAIGDGLAFRDAVWCDEDVLGAEVASAARALGDECFGAQLDAAEPAAIALEHDALVGKVDGEVFALGDAVLAAAHLFALFEYHAVPGTEGASAIHALARSAIATT